MPFFKLFISICYYDYYDSYIYAFPKAFNIYTSYPEISNIYLYTFTAYSNLPNFW